MSSAPCSRRSFLQHVSSAALAFGSPVILRATDKAGTSLPVVSAGEHTFEVHHDWGELPAGLKYGNTHGVVQDANGFIYVHHTVAADSERHDSMVVFDEKGRFVRSWGPEFMGGAHGLHIEREGRDEFLYLCDTKRAVVVKTTLTGEVVWTLGYPHESPQYAPGADGKPIKYSPTNVAIAPNGDVYVADGYGSSYINQYTSAGKYIRTFGGRGSGPGQLDCPHGLIVDRRGPEPVLLVADRTNRRLQVFSLEGKPQGIFEGTTAPCHFSVRNGVMVVPDLFARVTLIDRRNQIIGHLGEAGIDSWKAIRSGPRDRFPAGKFVCPHGACFDHEGNIFVVEWVEVGRVTKLRRV
ncbi:MAG TPA: hypothetical protein VIL35_08980 [Vicinamibacterales bacterium]